MSNENFERPIKHKLIYDKLCNDIIKGIYKPGEKLPTENELAETFKTSRPTIGRAMRDLQQKGLIARRQGQGTFVTQSSKPSNQTLGLLIHWQIRPVQTTSSTIFGIMVPELLKYASRSEERRVGKASPAIRSCSTTSLSKIIPIMSNGHRPSANGC
jgi:DNA-binding transcriptional regulator YhcF (GntR family)